jgi:hypothetical protein
MGILFVLAALVPGSRAQLLALATLAAAIWLGWDALADGRPGPRARLVMAFGLIMLAALPALLLAFDHGLWIGPPQLHGLDAGLALWSLGIAAIAVGSRAAAPPSRPPSAAGQAGQAGEPGVRPSPRRPGRLGALAIAAIVLVSLAAFVHKVGGPIEYFKNLNNSAATNAGLTYLIWGISFAKYTAFAFLAEAWAAGRPPTRAVLGGSLLAFLLILFLGSRLLILVTLIQLLLLYAAIRPTSRRFWRALTLAALIGVVVFVGLGEYRRWENVAVDRPSFPSYFTHTSIPNLPRTYANNYADTVRSSVLARQIVPARAPYEDGKELLRVLLQPLPGSIRPKVALAPAVAATFTAGHKNANALARPVVGYLQFGLAGDVVFCLLLGLLVAAVERLARRIRDTGELLAAIGASTGLVIVFRGTLHNAIAFAAIDVIGFFVAHRLLFSGRTDRSCDLPAADAIALPDGRPPSAIAAP